MIRSITSFWLSTNCETWTKSDGDLTSGCEGQHSRGTAVFSVQFGDSAAPRTQLGRQSILFLYTTRTAGTWKRSLRNLNRDLAYANGFDILSEGWGLLLAFGALGDKLVGQLSVDWTHRLRWRPLMAYEIVRAGGREGGITSAGDLNNEAPYVLSSISIAPETFVVFLRHFTNFPL
jgi:hypothetical protein